MVRIDRVQYDDDIERHDVYACIRGLTNHHRHILRPYTRYRPLLVNHRHSRLRSRPQNRPLPRDTMSGNVRDDHRPDNRRIRASYYSPLVLVLEEAPYSNLNTFRVSCRAREIAEQRAYCSVIVAL